MTVIENFRNIHRNELMQVQSLLHELSRQAAEIARRTAEHEVRMYQLQGILGALDSVDQAMKDAQDAKPAGPPPVAGKTGVGRGAADAAPTGEVP